MKGSRGDSHFPTSPKKRNIGFNKISNNSTCGTMKVISTLLFFEKSNYLGYSEAFTIEVDGASL